MHNKKGAILPVIVIILVLLTVLSSHAWSEQQVGASGEREISLFLGFDEAGESTGSEPFFAGSAPADTGNGRCRAVELNETAIAPGGIIPGDVVVIDLFTDLSLKARIDRVSAINGVATTRGMIEGSEFGFFLMSSDGGRVLASIDLPEINRQYILSYDSLLERYYLHETCLDGADRLPGGSPLLGSPERENREIRDNEAGIMGQPAASGDPDEQVTIDLMVVYTTRATIEVARYGNIDLVIAQAVGRAQTTLDNSGVFITLNLVHSAQVNYTESGCSETDLKRLTYTEGEYAVYMDEVHLWRDEYGADLVTLFTSTNDYAGVAWLLEYTDGDPEMGFSICRAQYAHDSHVLIHELGHNMGLHHHKEQSRQPGPGLFDYSAGWRWIGNDGGKYASIMTDEGNWPDGRYIVVPYISNPQILHQGVPTGDPQHGDNARTLRKIKHVIAAYRTAPPSPPPNNNFSEAAVITGPAGQVTANNEAATKEQGEPDHAGNDGGASAWWSWTAAATGRVEFNTFGSDFDTLLAVYTGEAVDKLTEVAGNMDADLEGGVWQSRLFFNAVEGGVYKIAVDGFNGASGNIVLNWNMDHALLRIEGANRYETAVEVSRFGWVYGSHTVLLARGDDFPDSLAGVPLAHALGAPILLTPTGSLHEATRKEILRLGAERVIILGGESAVAQDVEETLQSDMGLAVERIGGENRLATAALIATRLADEQGGNPRTAMIVYSHNFPDALAAASYAAQRGNLILLSSKERLAEHTRQAIAELGINRAVIIGGTAVIDEAVRDELAAMGLDVERVGGDNRYETAVKLAEIYLPAETGRLYLATGSTFPDALSGGVAAAADSSGVLLIRGDREAPPREVEDFVLSREITGITILGGEAAVSRELKKWFLDNLPW